MYQAGLPGLVEQVEQVEVIDRCRGGQDVDVEFVADHRRDGERRLALRGQPAQAPPHHIAHGFRDLHGPGARPRPGFSGQ